jgi:hypothetical protein
MWKRVSGRATAASFSQILCRMILLEDTDCPSLGVSPFHDSETNVSSAQAVW